MGGGEELPLKAKQHGGGSGGTGDVFWPMQMASMSVCPASRSLLWHLLCSASRLLQLGDAEMALATDGRVELTQETTESVVIVDVLGAPWYSPKWE